MKKENKSLDYNGIQRKTFLQSFLQFLLQSQQNKTMSVLNFS